MDWPVRQKSAKASENQSSTWKLQKRALYILLHGNCGLHIFISLIFSKYVLLTFIIHLPRTRGGGGLWFGPLGSDWELVLS